MRWVCVIAYEIRFLNLWSCNDAFSRLNCPLFFSHIVAPKDIDCSFDSTNWLVSSSTLLSSSFFHFLCELFCVSFFYIELLLLLSMLWDSQYFTRVLFCAFDECAVFLEILLELYYYYSLGYSLVSIVKLLSW